MIPLHLGSLHPFEQVMVIVLALGPLLLLVAVVLMARKRDAEAGDGTPGADSERADDEGA